MASRRNPTLEPPEGLRITKLRHDGKCWHANVSLGNGSIPVQSEPFWSTAHEKGQPFRVVLPRVAAALQGAVATKVRSDAKQQVAA